MRGDLTRIASDADPIAAEAGLFRVAELANLIGSALTKRGGKVTQRKGAR